MVLVFRILIGDVSLMSPYIVYETERLDFRLLEAYSWVSRCRSRGGGCFWWGRRAGGVDWRSLLGRICPKRRGLKPRWPGCLQETVR